ncbi:caspase family protein [Herpetosiphon llansteffanensis]|uniref:caspase family protein n=1 Tax=Herpetosiphon llansteffanensis TaxID=2094568 RepID=UPI000D7CCE07|nr:caspase family protein [Herpetosiphon llansteffanensis]
MGTFENGYALLVGVGNHRDDYYTLPTSVNDVYAIEAILRHPSRCGYPANQIKLLHDDAATTQGIRENLTWLKDCAHRDPSATIIFYYSGHGIRDERTDEYFLLPHDGFDAATGLTATELSESLQAISAQRLLVLLDCCHSGGMAKSGNGLGRDDKSQWAKAAPDPYILEALRQGTGRVIISSSSGRQKSYIRKDFTLSIFTFHLLEALQGSGNLPGSQEVRVSNLMNYLSDQVKHTTSREHGKEQTPFMQAAAEDFPIALIRGGKGLTKGGWEAEQADAHAAIEAAATINRSAVVSDTTVHGDIRQSITTTGSIIEGDSYGGNNVKGDQTVNESTITISGSTIHGQMTGINNRTMAYTGGSSSAHTLEYRLSIECNTVLSHNQDNSILVRFYNTQPGTRYRAELRASGIKESCYFKGSEVVFYITPAHLGRLDLRALLYDTDESQIAQVMRSVDVR